MINTSPIQHPNPRIQVAQPQALRPAETAAQPAGDRLEMSGTSALAEAPALQQPSHFRRIGLGIALAAALGGAAMSQAFAFDGAWAPHVIVGAPSVSLDARIPSPVYRPTPVAIEIAKGIGFGLDGHSLVVSDAAPAGTKIEGHLDGGTYPQRDFTVSHEGGGTQLNGYFGGQNYTMTHDGGVLRIGNENPEFSSTVSTTSDGTVVDGPKEAQHYDIHPGAGGTVVQGLERVVVRSTSGGGAKISSPERDLSFQVTPTVNGLHIEGSHKFNSYDVTFTDHGFVIQGAFPSQHVVVTTPE